MKAFDITYLTFTIGVSSCIDGWFCFGGSYYFFVWLSIYARNQTYILIHNIQYSKLVPLKFNFIFLKANWKVMIMILNQFFCYKAFLSDNVHSCHSYVLQWQKSDHHGRGAIVGLLLLNLCCATHQYCKCYKI